MSHLPSSATQLTGILGNLPGQPADALLALIGLHAADLRPHRIDIGVGVYRAADGSTPILRAVKEAERRLLATQSTKAYLGAEGDQRYTDLLSEIVFGEATSADGRLTGVQTPGGTGALRLAAELIARAQPDAEVWVGTPTWPNHIPLLKLAGLAVRTYEYVRADDDGQHFGRMMTALADAPAGAIILLHGCCHNPTGASLTAAQWGYLTKLCAERSLVPFVDLAYQGLGEDLDEDASGVRALVAALPEALVAYSCDKNFGLYRERVGALWVLAKSRAELINVRANMLTLSRSLWSMPPDHGAAIVRVILDDARLREDWRHELDGMRSRINALRSALAANHPLLAPVGNGRGMFAMLPLSTSDVIKLRTEHGIYMADSGRINIAGLNDQTLPTFVAALAPLLGTPPV